MSKFLSKTGLFRLFLAAAALALSACNGGSDDVSNVVSGAAQKGPMVGATIMVYKIDASGARSGESAGGTTDADGRYTINVPWAGPSEIVAQGTYTDELTGLPSIEVITIRALAHIAGSTVCNLNLFTHLSSARTLVDMGSGSTFSAARAAAESALLTAFGLDPDTDVDTLNIMDGAGAQATENAQLLLASAAISKYASDNIAVTTTDLLDSMETDFSDDGLLNGSGADTLGDIGTVAITIDLDTDIALSGTDMPDSTDLVTPVWLNHTPVAASVAAQSTSEDTASAGITLGGSDADGDSLQVAVTAGPTTGALNVTAGSAPLSVVYTPNENYNGSDSFSYRVSDGIAESEPITVAITVNPVNDAPVATAVSTVNTPEDTIAANISLTGTDAENDALTVEIVNNPDNGGLTFTGNTAPLSVTYIPAADYNGSDSFQFRVNDGNDGNADSDPVTVNVAISAVNDAPEFATVANQAATDGAAFSVTVGATDADGDTLTYSSTGTALPSWATLNTATGEISGTPDTVATTSGIEISANDNTTTAASNSFDLAVAAAADGASCAHILGDNPGAADGVYTVDPDGDSGVAPFDVYCDMTTDGGGWAKIYQYPTRFFNSSTDAVGNIAVATNTVEAKLSDAQINAFQTLSGANGSEFRMAGNQHPSGHKLYVRSSGTWQDDVTAFQLFNPQPAAGNNLAACLAADWASCNLGNYTHPDYWLDTLRMGGGNLPTADNATRYFIDHSTTPRCWNNGVYPERCFATGASAGNAPIGDFTMWIRPHYVTNTFTVTETAGDDIATTDLRDFFLALVNEGNVTNADWLLFDLPGATAENGGTCTNNAAWALDKYLFYYGGTTTFATWAGDGVDPDGAGIDYSSVDGTTGLQVWAYRSSDTVKTWDQETIPAQGIRHYNPLGNSQVGAWSPNYCTVPTTGTDLCLAVIPSGTGTNELYQDGSFSNGLTLTIRVGSGGASRMDVCGF